MDSLADLLLKAAQAPGPTPQFQVGQTVRVRSTLYVNTLGVEDRLGRLGVIDRVNVTMISKRVIYMVRFPDGRVEPFEEDELDGRFKRKAKP